MELREKFGFGCMRFPMKGKEVDLEQVNQMVDEFIEAGFNYFDTAHGYLDGASETALRECLVQRYPRDAYYLTNKLTSTFFQTHEDLQPFFEKQLRQCGVNYFDYYLLHAMNLEYYKKFTECGAFEFVQELKQTGKIRHIGMSFHDQPEVLDQILNEHPEIEVVQIQFNYLDTDNPNVESDKVYEVCVKHQKPVIVMEPVRGGRLADLPEEAGKVLDSLNGGSYASYALRYAASFDQVFMVLSGMSSIEQVRDNLATMKNFKKMNEEEFKAVAKVREILKTLDQIECTACQYCVAGCPKQIPIPDIFAIYNTKKIYNDWTSTSNYKKCTENKGKASDCIKCGKCEHACPQHLKIRDLLQEAAKIFE